jgi:DNA-binding response OmpR family regulator
VTNYQPFQPQARAPHRFIMSGGPGLKTMRILVVEDDLLLANRVRQLLEVEGGAEVTHVALGRDAQSELNASHFDVIVLDLTLPDMDGLQVLEEIRAQGDLTPVLILSARSTASDKVLGLEGGADDYLAKPFDAIELVARVRTIVRRHAAAKHTEARGQGRSKLGDLVYDPRANCFYVDEVGLDLTRQLHQFLELLMKRSGQVVSKEQLMAALNADGDGASMDRAASRLRSVLAKAGSTVTVRAIKGLGYSLAVSDDRN